MQPPTKKNTSSESISMKIAIAFGGGFLSGLLVAGALYITYLSDLYATDDSEYSEALSSGTTDNTAHPKTSPPTEVSEDQTENQSIDYQFYEKLKTFVFPTPVADPPPQNETVPPLIQNAEDGVSENSGRSGDKDYTDELPVRYILQAGTFTNAVQAQIQRRKILDLGYKDVLVFQGAYNNEQHYRVWLGPYSELGQARRIRNALKAAQIEVVLRPNLRSIDLKE